MRSLKLWSLPGKRFAATFGITPEAIMRWGVDPTRRFKRRPYYSYGDLDRLADSRITAFLKKHHGRVQYPVSTEDLTILLEEFVSDLDLFHDFPEPSVEAVTVFVPGRKPKVLISRLLSEDPRREHRQRTTITHEFGHVVLHSRLYEEGLIVQEQQDQRVQRCADTGMPVESTDWLEWQARYFSGAVLIPAPALTHELRGFNNFDVLEGPFEIGSDRADEFTQRVANRFGTSLGCARVRLEQAGILFAPLSELELKAIHIRPLPPGLLHIAHVLPRIAARVGLRVSAATEI